MYLSYIFTFNFVFFLKGATYYVVNITYISVYLNNYINTIFLHV